MGGAVETSTPSQRQREREPKTASNDPFDHELRYLLSRGEMRRFLDAIAARAAIEIYDPERPISYTRTTYLDTDDLAYFRRATGHRRGASASVSTPSRPRPRARPSFRA